MGEVRKPRYACVFSSDRKCRYTLSDVWNYTLPPIVFIGLNPSTADEFQLDPTLTRIRFWANSWGYGAFMMLNLFALRTPHPSVMKQDPFPIGPLNDATILRETAGRTVVACWGNHGSYMNRADKVSKMLRDRGTKLYCLGRTKEGAPIHPMARGKHRLPAKLQLQPFNP